MPDFGLNSAANNQYPSDTKIYNILLNIVLDSYNVSLNKVFDSITHIESLVRAPHYKSESGANCSW